MGLYRDLLKRIDELSFGFPKSFVGADLILIKKIFSREDAQDFLLMEKGYHTAEEYAAANGFSVETAKEKLDRMAGRGLIFRRHRERGDEYSMHPFVMGFLEWQGARPNVAKDWLLPTSIYMITSGFGKRMSQTTPFYRTIPMHKEFVEGSVVQAYDDIESLLDAHSRFAVSVCMCRLMDKVKPKNPCTHPLETCIVTDDYADFYIETGIGREISKEEALAILREGEKDGRIIQATNSQGGENFCSCCACGCGMLALRRMFPGPSAALWSNHFCWLDEEKCIHCGRCAKRCTFGYIKFDPKTKTPIIDSEACLGCGLCVSTCPTKALRLHQKSPDKLYTPPPTYDDAVEIWEAETKKNYDRFK